MTTSNGIKIVSQSNHFVERILGTMDDPKNHKIRSGVEIQDIKDALENPLKINDPKTKINSKGEQEISQKFIGEKATVTVNPDTGALIQCNPTDSHKSRRYKDVQI